MGKKKGGASPYKRGAMFERTVQRAYEAQGWTVTRQPKSQSPYDLICVRWSMNTLTGEDNTSIHLVQCKLSKTLRPHERNSIIIMADAIGAVPVLAWKVKGQQKIGWEDLRTGDTGELDIESGKDED